MKTIMESPRIRFVELTEELVPQYLEMVNDYENVGRYISKKVRVYSVEDEIAFVRGKLDEAAPIMSMLDMEDGEFIGNIEYMDREGDTAELGIAVTAKKQDVGFGKEAIRYFLKYGADALGLRRVTLRVYPDNARAIHVYEQCGFVMCGRTEVDLVMKVNL